jgi:hypothetical protein
MKPSVKNWACELEAGLDEASSERHEKARQSQGATCEKGPHPICRDWGGRRQETHGREATSVAATGDQRAFFRLDPSSIEMLVARVRWRSQAYDR